MSSLSFKIKDKFKVGRLPDRKQFSMQTRCS